MKIVTTRKVFHVFASEKAALVRFKIFAFPFFFFVFIFLFPFRARCILEKSGDF